MLITKNNQVCDILNITIFHLAKHNEHNIDKCQYIFVSGNVIIGHNIVIVA